MQGSLDLPDLEHCQRCPRLVDYLAQLPPRRGRQRSEYWNRSVAGFGDTDARLWLVGLAPGAHGANRTGRPFTGDGAGDFMYPLLHEGGFSNQAEATSIDDGLQLIDLYISNAVKCVPPANKPTAAEFNTCRSYLVEEWRQLSNVRVILALGRDAFLSVLRMFKELGMVDRPADYPFKHNGCYLLPNGQRLLACYHTSRYNVQTRRMTPELFQQVLTHARQLMDDQK
ncbi:MAG: uracil-DNA glycosylase [Desulfuromonas sp.]|nr:uracil-DNA glycosylase [Desulfuromonas sp.]